MDVRAAQDPLLQQVLGGRFQLSALIGSGGMGRVYRAVDLQSDAPVAVKVMAFTSNGPDDDAERRFRTEIRASSELRHPNVVRLIDSGIDVPTRLAFSAMELLDGPNLQTVISRVRTMDVQTACQLTGQILAGVGAAHALKILHRDLKPANVMLVPATREGEVEAKVVDFGLAKLLGRADGPSTKTGVVLGTVGYMSPEQAMGDEVDERTDVYAVGAILYRLLSGRLPYPAEDDLRALLKALQADPAPISSIPPDLDRVVRWAMARDRQKRCASATGFREALLRWASPTLQLDLTKAAEPTQAAVPRLELDLGPATPAAETRRTVDLRPPLVAEVATPRRVGELATPRPGAPRVPRRLVTMGVLASAALVGGVVFARRARRRWEDEVRSLLAANAFGVAESLILDHADEVGTRADAAVLVQSVLRGRRESDPLPIEFNAGYALRPSTWKGRTTEARSNRTQGFVLTIDKVVGRSCAGVLDWPDVSVRTAIRGIHEGNHLVFTDYELIAGQLPGYLFNEKKAVFIEEPRMRGVDGPFRVPLEAELVSG